MYTLTALILLSALSVNVLAGHAMWESKLEYHEAPQQQHIAIDSAGYAIRDNATSTWSQKRWLGMKTDGFKRLWPDKTVSYCYATQEAKTKMQKYMKAAINLWMAAGLHRDVYKYKEVADPGLSCENHSQRDAILVIRYRAEGTFLDATVGLQMLDANNPKYKGPEMNLMDSEDYGMKDSVIANVAHELGHVWGLYHEHQNKYFWGDPYSLSQGKVFGNNFNCKALADYEEAYQRVWAGNTPVDVNFLCYDQKIAAKYDFSAADWLPIKDQTLSALRYHGSDYDAVDWESIMLYDSSAFAKDDQKALLKNDGTDIEENFRPSLGDAGGIRTMYEIPGFFGQVYPTLPNSTKSKWYTKFMDMFRKKKGCN